MRANIPQGPPVELIGLSKSTVLSMESQLVKLMFKNIGFPFFSTVSLREIFSSIFELCVCNWLEKDVSGLLLVSFDLFPVEQAAKKRVKLNMENSAFIEPTFLPLYNGVGINSYLLRYRLIIVIIKIGD